MSSTYQASILLYKDSSFFLKDFKTRAFVKEVEKIGNSISLLPEGATILYPDLIFEHGSGSYRGALVSYYRMDINRFERNLWLETLLSYAKSAPAHSVVWLEQGVFYWLDDFSIIRPPMRLSCRGYTEEYTEDLDVSAVTKAKSPYTELIQGNWVLSKDDYSYRDNPMANEW